MLYPRIVRKQKAEINIFGNFLTRRPLKHFPANLLHNNVTHLLKSKCKKFCQYQYQHSQNVFSGPL